MSDFNHKMVSGKIREHATDNFPVGKIRNFAVLVKRVHLLKSGGLAINITLLSELP